MTHPATYHSPSTFDITGAIEADPDEFGRLLGPVVAGARARGVADAFELMGVAAVLIDGAGRVLHAGGCAERTLLPLIRITENHLVGVDAPTNIRLQTLIESALRSESTATTEVKFSDATGRPRLSMKALRFPHDGPAGAQLLRAIIVATEFAR